MNVGRLAAAAKAILQDFQRTKILDVLQLAINLAANRPLSQQNDYNREVEKIRSHIEQIATSDILQTFPNDMSQTFRDGSFSSLTPSQIARVMLLGVSYDKNTSMSSAELIFIRDSANNFINILNTLVKSFQALKLDYISVPGGRVSIDILIPRIVFDNKSKKYIKILNAFNDVINYIQEASNQAAEESELIYTSTTDPVTAIGIGFYALLAVLTYYEKMLDVAKKQIDILKSFKELRAHAPDIKLADDRSPDDVVRDATKKGIIDATNAALVESGIDKDNPRRSEIGNAIEMKSLITVSAIANGARMSISIESLVSLSGDLQSAGIDYDKALKLMESNKELEQAVTDNLRLFSENVPLLENTNRTDQK